MRGGTKVTRVALASIPPRDEANVDAKGGLSFPDGPRQELDQALADLLAQAERVRITQGRLRALLNATQAVVEEIDLPSVLMRIAEAARSLVDAEYAALGVISPERDGLEEFVHAGISDEHAARIGHLPVGRGLLGTLITDPRTIRLEHLKDDPRSVGFPAHHPPMDSFLGVPVRIRDEIFGNLYLTNHREGLFTEEDAQLIEALATTAGFAIENARLLERVRHRGQWMEAAAGLSAALLSSPTETAPDLIAGRMFELPGIDKVTVLLAGEDTAQMQIAAARGTDEAEIRGILVDVDSMWAGEALQSAGAGARVRERSGDDALRVVRDGIAGSAVVAALRTPSRLWGAVCAARGPNGPRFSDTEVEAATHFGSRAAIALELAHARGEAQRALLADDRRRIARDLHDHVIQQLYGTGLSIQAVAAGLDPGSGPDRLHECVDQLDDAVSQIRTIVFALSHPDESSLRHRVIDVVADLSASLAHPPAIRFSGPVDHAITGALADDVVGATRELLSNAVRHSHADRISVDVIVDEADVTVVLEDDGVGIPAEGRRSGLRNLAEKAAERGGALSIRSASGETVVRWRAPLSADAADREGAPG